VETRHERTTTAKAVPYSVETEQALLASIIVSGGAVLPACGAR